MKNGKLFGKLNIIDILIILVIIAALAFAGIKLLGGNSSTQTAFSGHLNTQQAKITFLAEETPYFLPDSIAVGDAVEEYNTTIPLGKLTSFSTEDAYTYAWDPEAGEAVKVPVVNTVFMTFTIEATGNLAANGFTVQDVTYVVGGNYYLNIGNTRVGCRLVSMEDAG